MATRRIQEHWELVVRVLGTILADSEQNGCKDDFDRM